VSPEPTPAQPRVAIAAEGRPTLGLDVDVTDRDRIADAVAEVRETLGAPTILVNSAGMDGFEGFPAASGCAAACAFLVRDEAGYITGQVLPINGERVTV
jgi:NAD(P)-dependent dehydrogenase (short-subunit alcohol dehydrogenase family)